MIAALALAGTIGVPTFAKLSLAQAEADALAASPTVAAARDVRREAQAAFQQARAAFGPALTASYSAAPQANAANTGTMEQQLTTVGAQVTLGDLLAYSPALAQANSALLAARFQLHTAELTERTTVVGLYYDALQAHATLRARNDALALAQSQERAATIRFKAGDVPRVDVVRADVAVAQAQASLATAQSDEMNAEEALAVETGIAVPQLHTQTTAGASLALLPAPQTAVARALAGRPEVAAAEANVAAERAAVRAAERMALPIFTLSGGYQTGNDTNVHIAAPTLNATLTYPLGNPNRYRAQAERARLAQAQAQLAQTERSITLAVAAAARNYQAQGAAVTATQRALAESRRELHAEQIGYRSGAVSSLDVENARSTYVQALLNAIAAAYARAKAAAQLQLLTGR